MTRYFLDDKKGKLWDVVGNPSPAFVEGCIELTHLEWELVRILGVYDIEAVRTAIARFEYLFQKEVNP